jgi:hypothetical protein
MLKGNDAFAWSFGVSVGMNFSSLSKPDQNEAWKLAEKFSSFASGFGSVAGDIASYKEDFKSMITAKLQKDSEIAYSLGNSLGYMYISLNDDERQKFWQMTESELRAFPFGFGEGLGEKFSFPRQRY